MTPSLRRTRQRRLARNDALHRQHRLAAIAHGPLTYWPPLHCRRWPWQRLGIACTPPDTLPCRHVLYECHTQQPGDRGPAPALTYTQVLKFGRF